MPLLDYGDPASGGAVPVGTDQFVKSAGGGILPFFEPNPAAGAAVTSVSGSASSVTLLAANTGAAGRVGSIIVNDSTATLYLKFGSSASTTSFTVKLLAGEGYEFPAPIYQGLVTGIWNAAAGSARITELT